MKARIVPSRLEGRVRIPGSKSHTIRAVAIAALADGRSRIEAPLESADTLAALHAYTQAGATVERGDDLWVLTGTAGDVRKPGGVVDVGNSGTTLRLAMGSFTLLRDGVAVLTGDEQIRRRPAAPLVRSLNDLGGRVKSLGSNDCAPFEVGGRLRGGRTSIEAVTSQYISSLLLAALLADGDSEIHVPLLNEAPYVRMTIDWAELVGARLEYADDLSEFRVAGSQSLRAFSRRIPADWSSATFILAAGALAGNEVSVEGLDMADSQGDKAVLEYLAAFGASVDVAEESVIVKGGTLRCSEIDLNATPDALPMMAVLACVAEGRTTLANVPQARIKETDRISVMASELAKMGADTRELPDGLVIEHSDLRGAQVEGHGDHRVVMALAVAGTAAAGETVINGAEVVSITFPTFWELMQSLGAGVVFEE